jgi:hypothetical protein
MAHRAAACRWSPGSPCVKTTSTNATASATCPGVRAVWGWRRVRVTARRTKQDFAEQLRLLTDEDYPDAEVIVLVVDNLNTHGPGCLYERFTPEEAHRLATKFEWHFTPEHRSWLNVAECELSVLARQCLGRRIPDQETLIRKVAAWEERRNQLGVKVDWQFTIADAHIKLKRLYPVIKEKNTV